MAHKASRSLLPSNATALERHIVDGDVSSPLWSLSKRLTELRIFRPSPFNDWLAGEWGISSFRQHFAGDAQFFDTSLQWLQSRGTAQAVRLALSMIDVKNVKLDNDHFWLHIHLDKPFRGDNAQFIYQVQQSIPLHLELYRITWGDDGRHGVYDYRNYDDAVYDSDAGVLIDGVLVDYADTLVAGDSIRVLAVLAHTADTMIGSPQRTWQTVSTWLDEAWSSTPALQITTETV